VTDLADGQEKRFHRKPSAVRATLRFRWNGSMGLFRLRLKGPSRRYAAFDKVDLGQLRAFAKRLKQAVERANGSAGAAGSEGARATGGAGDG
jgi:hypothetical protein